VNKLSQSTALLFALSFVSVAALGCANTVVSGGGGLGEDGANAEDACADGDIDCAQGGSGGGSQGGGGAPPGVEANAIAMLYGQIPWSDPGSGTGTTSGGGGPSADTLSVWIGGQPIACAAPFGLDCGSQWYVSFDLPPELQQPGTYALSDLNGFASETGPDGGDECWAGGGSYWDGTVTIDSIDGTAVTGTVNPTADYWEFDASGPFVAVRCP
jgi:hypothetical protein